MSDIKAFHRALEFKEELLESRDKVIEKGIDIGFESAKDFINLKTSYSSFWYAFPYTGKTSFIFCVLMHIAKQGKKLCIFSPEGGSKNSLVTYLVQVYLGKKLHGKNAQKATDEEWIEALTFIDNSFVILDPQLVGANKIEFSAQEMFKQVYMAQKEYGWKIDFLLCDPYNMLSKTKEERTKTLADYTLESLTYINHVAREMDLHVMIAMHLRDEEMIVDKDTGVEYFKKPHPTKIANGQSVFRVMQQGVGIWRCPTGVIEQSTGIPYPENATDFFIQKNKVIGAGQTGSFRLYYDDAKQRFYEIIGGVKYYCGEYEARQKNKNKPSAMQPNLNFGKDVENPF